MVYCQSQGKDHSPGEGAHARALGVDVARVKIVDNRYRWGSCTLNNNVNLNWRLIKAPMFVIDYVIVHELAHLIEANHTPRFWNIVRVQTPDNGKGQGVAERTRPVIGARDMKKREPDKTLIKDKRTKGLDAWSEWRPFPDPRDKGYLIAPFGPGVYPELRKSAGELVLFGQSKNVAQRMTSLLPQPLGCGTRKNQAKRKYIFDNLADIEYRTLACVTVQEAKEEEEKLKASKNQYKFST